MSLYNHQQIHAALIQRRTIHDFLPDRVPPWRDVEVALQAACFAPNHYFTQPWRFYAIGDKTKQAIVDLNADLVARKRGPEAGEKKRRRWTEIPGWLVITCERSSQPLRAREDYAACCCAIQNLMLDLWARGVGCKWTSGDIIREPAFYRLLGIKAQQQEVVALLWYGYPAVIPRTMRSKLDSKLTRLP